MLSSAFFPLPFVPLLGSRITQPCRPPQSAAASPSQRIIPRQLVEKCLDHTPFSPVSSSRLRPKAARTQLVLSPLVIYRGRSSYSVDAKTPPHLSSLQLSSFCLHVVLLEDGASKSISRRRKDRGWRARGWLHHRRSQHAGSETSPTSLDPKGQNWLHYLPVSLTGRVTPRGGMPALVVSAETHDCCAPSSTDTFLQQHSSCQVRRRPTRV